MDVIISIIFSFDVYRKTGLFLCFSSFLFLVNINVINAELG